MQGETREALPPPSKVKKGVFGIIVYRLFFSLRMILCLLLIETEESGCFQRPKSCRLPSLRACVFTLDLHPCALWRQVLRKKHIGVPSFYIGFVRYALITRIAFINSCQCFSFVRGCASTSATKRVAVADLPRLVKSFTDNLENFI